jgi:hypothetical protein
MTLSHLRSCFYTSDKNIAGNIYVDKKYIDSFITNNSSKKIKIVLTVDVSVSMNNKISGSKKSKLDIVKDSLVEILEYLTVLGDNNHDIEITLLLFSTDVVLSFCEKVNSSTKTTLISKIKNIKTINSTNIFKAILESDKHIQRLSQDNGSEVFAMFATDGNNTDFNKDIEDSARNSKFLPEYVGIGMGLAGDDYDSILLNDLFGKNFFGCPTSEEISNVIIENIFSVSSCLMKSMMLSFNEEVLQKYEINTPLEHIQGGDF